MKKNKQSGQVILGAALFSAIISLLMTTGVVGPAVISAKNARRVIDSKESFFLAEAGIEDVTHRLKQSYTVDSPSIISLNGRYATTTITDVSGNEKKLSSAGEVNSSFRKSKATLTTTSGASFSFGVQTDTGGFFIENSATVRGNLYSNGPIVGNNSPIIYGDIISAGPNGLIDNIYTTGTAYSNSIQNSTIDTDVYYQTISNTTVLGTEFPESTDQATTSLPITDEKIEEWKTIAAGGTVINSPCPYKIEDTITIGPAKINCDLEISGVNYDVSLAGHIWVNGNIIIKNSPNIMVDPSMGNEGLVIIADKESDRASGGTVLLDNTTTFEGNGNSSYIMVLSKNNSAQNDGGITAINIKNSVSGDVIVYAGEGEIAVENFADLKQITAFKTSLKNNIEITYETGLASTVFSSGPGGTWKIGNWRESE